MRCLRHLEDGQAMPAPYYLTCLRCLRLATRGACADENQCLRCLRHAEAMPAPYYLTCLRCLRLATRGLIGPSRPMDEGRGRACGCALLKISSSAMLCEALLPPAELAKPCYPPARQDKSAPPGAHMASRRLGMPAGRPTRPSRGRPGGDKIVIRKLCVSFRPP